MICFEAFNDRGQCLAKSLAQYRHAGLGTARGAEQHARSDESAPARKILAMTCIKGGLVVHLGCDDGSLGQRTGISGCGGVCEPGGGHVSDPAWRTGVCAPARKT